MLFDIRFVILRVTPAVSLMPLIYLPLFFTTRLLAVRRFIFNFLSVYRLRCFARFSSQYIRRLVWTYFFSATTLKADSD